jgi:hypothetical protein
MRQITNLMKMLAGKPQKPTTSQVEHTVYPSSATSTTPRLQRYGADATQPSLRIKDPAVLRLYKEIDLSG